LSPIAPSRKKIDAVPQFDKWRGIPTGWLVTGHVTPAANQRIKVEFRLWNVIKGEQVLGQQYFLRPEDWRRVSHVIAEVILKRLSDE
jgi:TolB protein